MYNLKSLILHSKFLDLKRSRSFIIRIDEMGKHLYCEVYVIKLNKREFDFGCGPGRRSKGKPHIPRT